MVLQENQRQNVDTQDEILTEEQLIQVAVVGGGVATGLAFSQFLGN